MTYKEYLETDHWALISLKCRQNAGNACEACGQKTCFKGWKLNSHHLRYRADLFECTPDDLMALCTDCHGSFHAWKEKTGCKGVSFSRSETRYRIRSIRFLDVPSRKPRKQKKEPTPRQKRRAWSRFKKKMKKQGKKNKNPKNQPKPVQKQWNAWPQKFTPRVHY